MSASDIKKDNALEIVGGIFKAAVVRSKNGLPPENILPIHEDDYRQACKYLGDSILSKDLLLGLLKKLVDDFGQFKQLYAEDFDYCLAVIPTSDMGNPLSQQEISQNTYLYLLMRHKIEGYTSNFSLNVGPYFELLPKKIQENCTIKIHYSDDGQFVSPQDFVKIYNGYIDAFNANREFLGLERLDVPYWTAVDIPTGT